MLRTMFERARETLGRVRFTAGALRRMGLLGSVRPLGLLGFARRLTGLRFKPHHALILHATSRPNDLALVAVNRGTIVRFSFTALDRRINRLANALRDHGVATKATVGLMMRNNGDYVVAQEAVPRLGATAVQIGYKLKAPEVAHIIDNSRPDAFIIDVEFAETIFEALRLTSHKPTVVFMRGESEHPGTTSLEQAIATASEDDPPPNASSDGGSVIIYTSGTTGKPKGASRDLAKTGLSSVIDMLDKIGVRSDEKHLVVCPLYHSAAPAFVKMTYAVGGAVVVAPFFEAEDVLATIEREKITSVFMVPTQLRRMAELPAAVRDDYDTSSLRWVMSGAAPLPTETARAFQAAFGPILWNFYGATETGTVTLAGPADHLAKPGTVGRLLRENEARIIGEDGELQPPNHIGELWIRNTMLISGYHRNAEATNKSMQDGFFSVGDLARLDEDGYLFIESRVHDMIISGGVNIYPREIEDVLAAHPAITEAAVLGLPDSEWGESIAAFVVRAPESPGLDADEVIETCRTNLADFKKPRRVFFVDELPRNPTGKVLKRVLRESV